MNDISDYQELKETLLRELKLSSVVTCFIMLRKIRRNVNEDVNIFVSQSTSNVTEQLMESVNKDRIFDNESVSEDLDVWIFIKTASCENKFMRSDNFEVSTSEISAVPRGVRV